MAPPFSYVTRMQANAAGVTEAGAGYFCACPFSSLAAGFCS
jgi:hypothetical protein